MNQSESGGVGGKFTVWNKRDGRVISVTNERTRRKAMSCDKNVYIFIRKHKSRNINIQYAMKLEFCETNFLWHSLMPEWMDLYFVSISRYIYLLLLLEMCFCLFSGCEKGEANRLRACVWVLESSSKPSRAFIMPRSVHYARREMCDRSMD